MPERKVTVTVTNRTIVRTILWIGAAVAAYHFIGRISHILTLIGASLFLALALNPVVTWMVKKVKIDSRVRATAASYLLIIIILSAFITAVFPPLINQTRDYIKTIPTTVDNFQKQDNSLSRTIKRYHLDEKLSQGAQDFTAHYANIGTAVLDTGKRVAEAIASVLAVLVLTFMMLVEGPKWYELILGTFAEQERARYRRLSQRMYRSVTAFVNGQVLLAFVAGVFAFITLEVASHVLNVDINPVALAGIVALFGIIPLFGNPIAAILVCLACLLSSATLAIVMVIYFVIYFFIENHTLQPYLQSKFNELTPMTVFIAALVGVGFGGIMGAIIAIPAASAVKILLEDHFQRRQHRQPSIQQESI